MAARLQMPPASAAEAAELARVLEDSELAAWRDLWHAVPASVAVETGMHCVPVGAGVALVLEKSPTWLVNRVLKLGVGEPASEADVERLIHLYTHKGLDFAISLSPLAQPAELGAWLGARGFEVVNVWAKMVRTSGAPPAGETDLRIEKVGRERAAEIGELVCAGFGAPPAWRPIFAALTTSPANHVYLALVGGQPAAAGVLTLRDGVGYLNTATTLPQFRGRGLQGALIARRIRDGLALGCTAFASETGLLADSPNPSYRNLLRHGFRVVYQRPNYLRRFRPGSAQG